MEKKVAKLGVIGLGPRGRDLVWTMTSIEEIEITAVSDTNPNTFKEVYKMFDKANLRRPETYTDYNELLSRQDIEGVIIATHWITHIPLAIASMKAGKYAGVEVGGAASIEECWQLVRTYEETGIPCMLLENCCYGKYELMVLNMIKKGLFGEVVHCECGYGHDLREHLAGQYPPNNRLYNNIHRNGDLYPTHGVGPIAKMLNINRGNRFVSLTSMASKAAGLKDWIKKNKEPDYELAKYDFVAGDVVQTLIKCAHGETVLVTHNITLPRPYSRFNVVQGTNAIYMEDKKGIYIDGKSKEEVWEPIDNYYEEYGHPLWKKFEQGGVKGGHGGMDHLLLKAFADSVINKAKTPIDVYDTAAWMAITVLSEQSVNTGSTPVAFPDFTNGKWINRGDKITSSYSLDEVVY
ncbi:MAG: Gfo/Idh/MocA family oxidoreductase [Clostridiaceae bacterium]|jgi:predicted dehydrogenase|nr:Gfo/Idh/MocA family oxidoreductase [Clostridiaceae bacterium]